MPSPSLSLLIFLPLGCAAALALFPAAAARRFALGAAAAELVLALGFCARFDFASARLQGIERTTWIPSLHVDYLVGVDGLSVLFLPLTALLTLAVMVATWSSHQSQPRLYLALLLLLETATLGVFCALDLVLFFLFWELTLIPLFFLISLYGIGPRRRHAAIKYTLFMLAGGVPLLFGIMLLAFGHAEELSLPLPQGLCFDYLVLRHVPPPEELRGPIFLLLCLGFAVKAPLFPFHTWLPTVAMEGPAGVAALLTGLKLGLYGLIRFALPLVPDAARDYAGLLNLLGVVGLVYGALIALRQTNLRQLLAWSSISHVGLVAIGLGSLNLQGVEGALFQLLNFGLVSGGLFLIAGFLQHRLGATELAGLGGAAGPMPRLTAAFFLLGLAAMGVPGTNGFAAENLILVGAFLADPGIGCAVLIGMVLGAAYFLEFFRRGFLGPTRLENVATAEDLRPRELALAGALIALALFAGLAPGTVVEALRPAAEAWLAQVTAAGSASAYAGLGAP